MKYVNSAIAVAAAGLITAHATTQVTPPAAVQGKEYSNNVDETALGVADFLQNIQWDNPAVPLDTFDYSGSGPPPEDPDQVDALANHQDHLFGAVAAGAVPFVVSFESNPAAGFSGDDIYFHDTAGATGLWAIGPIDINMPSPPDDTDAVELWGLPVVGQQHDPMSMSSDDANNYSYIGDCIMPGPPAPPGTPKIIVFFFDPVLFISSIYITHDELRNALVAALPNIDPNLQVDLDALMVFDVAGNGIWEDGDSIIFSLRPTSDSILLCAGPPVPPFPSAQNPFDGGEIWTWTRGNPPQFLVHGGTVWDTANPVGNIFGVPTENIDAFEAVEEQPGNGEGCTPGFWKQPQHFGSWTAPYTPGTSFSDVFEDAFPGRTLLQVLRTGGGRLVALGRHTVAALLNAASPDVNYGLSANDVIDMFNDVFPGSDSDYEALKDLFEQLNESDCPIDNDSLFLERSRLYTELEHAVSD